MARSAGVKAIAKEEKRMEKERRRRIELANKMLIPVSKKTMETLGLISFDPNGVFRLEDNRWMRVFMVEGEPKALASIVAKLSGRIRIVWHFREDGGRATCHLVLMETGEIYEEVRQIMSKDEELLKEAVRMAPLSVDEVMNQIGEKFGQSIRFSYASYVRGNKDWKKECFLEIAEEADRFLVGRLYGEAFHALSYPSIIRDGFIHRLGNLGCQTYVSLDMNSLTAEEELDFNRAIEKRYNRRLSADAGNEYLNVSLSIVILCDSDDARKIIEKTVISIANGYELMLAPSFHEQRKVAESVISFGLIDKKIMRNVAVDVTDGLMGGGEDADAKIEV